LAWTEEKWLWEPFDGPQFKHLGRFRTANLQQLDYQPNFYARRLTRVRSAAGVCRKRDNTGIWPKVKGRVIRLQPVNILSTAFCTAGEMKTASAMPHAA
jgi:hypothetical protein